ncbi:MAG: sigma-70 family RNA polymerase sigma factor [candidate division Zixibacteria bacterium]|nr:sigma-70 family RNA polymerase sigma factor [candidate division Zixibacteria bacterium]
MSDNREQTIDRLLLQLIKEGNQAALASFYDRHSRLIYSLILRIVGRVPDAEEVTQEVFLKVWRSAGSFDSTLGSPLAWLTTVARRLAIDRTRSKHYKSEKSETGLDALEIDDEGGFEGQVASNRLESIGTAEHRVLFSAVERLSEEYRLIVELSYFSGHSHSEIAERLGCPVGTVKTRLRQALGQLRSILMEGKS